MDTWLALTHSEESWIIDKHYTISCPHCNAVSNLTAISLPRWAQMKRYNPEKVIVGFRCDSCNAPVALRFTVFPSYENNRVEFTEEYEELERPMETFDYQYLPEPVASDFREALTCYSHSCLNAAAAMCRRTVQSAATKLGAAGSAKVMSQIEDIKETAEIDEDTFTILKQIVIDGHDGAHPHLPTVTPKRARVLIELMRDVLHQLFVRKAKLQEAMELRKEAIDAKKAD